MNTIHREVGELRSSSSKVEGSLQSQQPLVMKIPDVAEKVGELKKPDFNLFCLRTVSHLSER